MTEMRQGRGDTLVKLVRDSDVVTITGRRLGYPVRIHVTPELLEFLGAPQEPRVRVRDALETAQRYIEHMGANQTERGLPHPQALLLTKIQEAIETMAPGDTNEEARP